MSFLTHQLELDLVESDQSTSKQVQVSMRQEVGGIPSTTYGLFGSYRYPAKFIPQVVAFALERYGRPGDRILDPFAGYGTTGLVCQVLGYEYELWDLNPALAHLHRTSEHEPSIGEIDTIVNGVRSSSTTYLPDWNRLTHWHPEPFLEELSRLWGFYHSHPDHQPFLTIPALHITRYFSYADDSIAKTYRSPYAEERVFRLLQSDWRPHFYRLLQEKLYVIMHAIWEHRALGAKPVRRVVRAGIDALTAQPEGVVDLVITSPPYLQAQEYIRSVKLELYWLGYGHRIRELTKLEIPYRPWSPTTIHSETYERYLQAIVRTDLRRIYECYFHSIVALFDRLADRVRRDLCIFVGPAKIDGTPIPIDRILAEHLVHQGWDHICTWIDQIPSHRLFQVERNPATGRPERRMETEHLLILRRSS